MIVLKHMAEKMLIVVASESMQYEEAQSFYWPNMTVSKLNCLQHIWLVFISKLASIDSIISIKDHSFAKQLILFYVLQSRYPAQAPKTIFRLSFVHHKQAWINQYVLNWQFFVCEKAFFWRKDSSDSSVWIHKKAKIKKKLTFLTFHPKKPCTEIFILQSGFHFIII